MVDKQDESKQKMQAVGDRAWTCLQGGEWDDALVGYRQAVELARQLGDVLAETLFASYAAVALRGLGRLGEARQELEHCLQLACQAQSEQLESHVRFLLSELDCDAFNHDAAAHQLTQALEAALSCGDAALTEMCFGKLGLIYFASGWMEQSCQCFRQALAARPDSANAVAWLGNLGQTLAELGMTGESIDSYRQALVLARDSGNVRAQGKCLASEALSHFQNADFDAAIECYGQALALADATGDRKSRGVWLGNLGNLYLSLGHIDKAEELCNEGLTLARELSDRHAEAAHLDSLGDCALRKGNADSALRQYDEALEIGRSISDKLGERIYAANVGRAHWRLGDRDKAFANLASAIDVFDEQRNRINSDNLKTSFAGAGQMLYQDMISLCLEVGRRVDALQYVGRAKSRALLDLLRNSPIDVSDLVTVQDQSIALLVEKEMHLRSRIEGLERLYWQGPGADSSRDQESGTGSGPGGGPSSDSNNDPDSGSGGTGQHRRVPDGASRLAESAPELYRDWRNVVDELRRRHPNYATMVAVQTLAFDEIASLWQPQSGKAACLSAGTAVVEFYLSAQFLYASAIWNGAGEPCTHTVMGADSIGTLTGDITDFLEMSATEGWDVPLSLCKRLYSQLLGPVLEQLPEGITSLLLVPHGVLHRVPFAALHDGTGYLAQKYDLSYLPSLSLIPVLSDRTAGNAATNKASADKASADKASGDKASGDKASADKASIDKAVTDKASADKVKCLVSAISDYSATRSDGIVLSSRLRSAAGLEDLGYTIEEGQSIFELSARHGGDARLLTNQDVKEGLLTMFGAYPVVHFAGHAVFNQDEPLASGLVLSDGSVLTAARILQDNALRTSCGKLLVLSACQTGVNVVTTGGEILGLARALMYAGMPNLILSLWEVADRSTAVLMQHFHDSWQVGATSIASALAQAQRKAIADNQPVHAWAPFVHFGID